MILEFILSSTIACEQTTSRADIYVSTCMYGSMRERERERESRLVVMLRDERSVADCAVEDGEQLC